MHVVVHQSILESDFINFEIGVLYSVIGKGSFLPRSLIRGSYVILYFSYNFCPNSNTGMAHRDPRPTEAISIQNL